MAKIKNVFTENAIPICFAANSAFIPYTAVMIKSIIEHRNYSDNYDIIVLYTDVSDDYIEKTVSLANGIGNVSIRFVDISEEVASANLFVGSVYTGTEYSREAYYRLLIPSLMPDYPKVLYFDGDMIAMSDVAELYHSTDMTGYMLASSRDYAGICNCYMEGDDRRDYRSRILGLKNVDNYIISGMLVFNTAEFNKRYTAVELMQICSSRDWRQHDQDVLNVICEDSLLLVDGSWDFLEDGGNMRYLPAELKAEYDASSVAPNIIHFAGPRKPWKNSRAFGFEHFWRFCYQTPFFPMIFKSVTGNYAYKNCILELLTGDKAELSFLEDNAAIHSHGFFIGMLGNLYTKIELLSYSGGVLRIEGFMNFIALEREEIDGIFISVDEKLIPAALTRRECSEYNRDLLMYLGVSFVAEAFIDPTVKHTIQLVCSVKGGNHVLCKNLRFSNFSPVNTAFDKFYFKDGVILTATCSQIRITPAGRRALIKHELRYLRALPNFKMRAKRICYYLRKLLCKKEIWLIADRYNAASDNAEAFFKHLLEKKPRGIKPYFVISKYSPDYARMKSVGRVIPLESRRFRFYRILADKMISSHCDREFCFDYDVKEMSDITAGQAIVFLQHGIIKDDLSSIYSRYKQNMDLFVTSARREYESIVENPNYGCDEKVAVLTGLPRYDLLESTPERIITIMPTWRRYCLTLTDGRWKINDDFEESEYFKFYSALLSDERLLGAAKAHGYRIDFVPHALMADGIDKIKRDASVNLVKQCNYTEVFAKTALMLTDFSSTAFDVAYLRKPVVYAHFDKEAFFKNQYSEGYFEYERDGFGEVEYDLDSTVTRLVEYIERDCALKDKYRQRIDGFFAFSDKNNCKRVFEKIIAIQK